MISGIGVDLCLIARMHAVLERRGEAFERRVFTDAERAYCARYRDPAPRFAARFAAKEAALKALGVGWQEGMTWKDFEVTHGPLGVPELLLHGASEEQAEARGIVRINLSLSHEEDRAIAFVVMETLP